jgi:hypothetical protein
LVGEAVKVTELPEQIAPAGSAAINTLTGCDGLTVIVDADDATLEHTPLCTNALNCVVWVNAPEVYVVLVFTMSSQSVPLVELCHLTIEPV